MSPVQTGCEVRVSISEMVLGLLESLMYTNLSLETWSPPWVRPAAQQPPRERSDAAAQRRTADLKRGEVLVDGDMGDSERSESGEYRTGEGGIVTGTGLDGVWFDGRGVEGWKCGAKGARVGTEWGFGLDAGSAWR